MKLNKWIFTMMGAAALLSSCADDFDTNDFVVAKPGDNADYEYLKEYAPLKSYVDRNKHANLKVSAALSASDFASKGNIYTLSRANFDEVVAGNEMKMASVVSDKGEMNFGTISEFVQAAEDGGISVFGHTLLWHSQQPYKWLNSLIADRKVETGGEAVETFVPVKKRVIKVESDDMVEAAWDTQFWIYTKDEFKAGDSFEFSADIYAYNEASTSTQLHYGAGEYVHWDALGNFPFTTEWTTYSKTGSFGANENNAPYHSVALNLNDLATANTFFFANLSLKINGVEQVVNGDLSGDDVSSFIIKEKRGTIKNATILDEYNERRFEQSAGTMMQEVTTTYNKRVIKVAATEKVAEAWDNQFWIYTKDEYKAGDSYEFSADILATKEASTGTQLHYGAGEYVHWDGLGNFPFTTEWTTFSKTGTFGANENNAPYHSVALNLNDFAEANDYYFANVSFKINGVEQIINGDLSGDDVSSFFLKINQGNPQPASIQDSYTITEMKEVPKVKETKVERRCIIVEADDMVDAPWDNQFWIYTKDEFKAGDSYEFSADIFASNEASVGTQLHYGAGEYVHWDGLGNFPFTTEWSTYSKTGTFGANENNAPYHSVALNLNDFAGANTYYFSNISLKVNGVEQIINGDLSGDDVSSFFQKTKRGNPGPCRIADGYVIVEEVKSTEPLSPEEKRDTLIYAMKQWMNGMMDATSGRVKSWDLINEAISGGGDVNGFYDLQHATPEADKDFFWQDYLGSEQYGVIAEKVAREAYAAIEGTNPADLKLFINDYNLESDWDQNKKLKSLIYWIGVWEKGGAKIDGIGTQMHISYYENAQTQESKKAAIVNMFKLMAATGKLVRISELDMGVVDANGNTVKNSEMTLDREKKMAEFYQWIIEQYYANVPAAQQYGVCQWCLTDAKEGDGWRADEPVGLWFRDYTRKPAYGGWAEGLKK